MNSINRILISKRLMEERSLVSDQYNSIKGLNQNIADMEGLAKHQDHCSIGSFLNFVDKRQASRNPFNNSDIIQRAKESKLVGTQYWRSYEEFQRMNGCELSPARAEVSTDYKLVITQVALIIIEGITKANGIVVDRKGRILDGYQRLAAYKLLQFPFYSIKVDLDFDQESIMKCKGVKGGLK